MLVVKHCSLGTVYKLPALKFSGIRFYIQIRESVGLFKPESLQQQTQANRLLALDVLGFISQHQVESISTLTSVIWYNSYVQSHT